MLRKDLKTGVVYLERNQRVKAVIVATDRTFEKPSGNINHQEQVLVKEGKGSKGGLLVLRAGLGYPDEQLIEDAKTLALPVPGEVWPYAVVTSVKYNHRLLPKVHHRYPELSIEGVEMESFRGPIRHIPSPSVWVTQQFGQEFGPWQRNKDAEKSGREAQALADKQEREAQDRAGELLVNRINALQLEDVDKNIVESRPWRSTGAVLLSHDVVESLLKRIEA